MYTLTHCQSTGQLPAAAVAKRSCRSDALGRRASKLVTFGMFASCCGLSKGPWQCMQGRAHRWSSRRTPPWTI
eukprot:7381419-Alexandrium_andersonii.AAC.1